MYSGASKTSGVLASLTQQHVGTSYLRASNRSLIPSDSHFPSKDGRSIRRRMQLAVQRSCGVCCCNTPTVHHTSPFLQFACARHVSTEPPRQWLHSKRPGCVSRRHRTCSCFAPAYRNKVESVPCAQLAHQRAAPHKGLAATSRGSRARCTWGRRGIASLPWSAALRGKGSISRHVVTLHGRWVQTHLWHAVRKVAVGTERSHGAGGQGRLMPATEHDQLVSVGCSRLVPWQLSQDVWLLVL